MNKQEKFEEQKSIGRAAVGLFIIFLLSRLLENYFM